MLNVNSSGRFNGDLKRCMKRGYDLQLLQNVVNILRIPAEDWNAILRRIDY